jgi:hypothetical protein
MCNACQSAGLLVFSYGYTSTLLLIQAITRAYFR